MTLSEKIRINAGNLSDYQLYQLTQNKKLDSIITQSAKDELKKRKLTHEEIKLLIVSHTLQFPDESIDRLKSSLRLLLILFPFFTEIHSLIAGRMLAKRQSQKWKDYWMYICLGYLLWLMVILLFVKFNSLK